MPHKPIPPGYCKIIGQIEGDGEVKPYKPQDRPTDTTRWEKTPTGLARGDHTPGMPDSYTPPEAQARLDRPTLPTKKRLPWYRQPEYLRQWGREDPDQG